MLSKTEKEYIEDMKAFEDKHGLGYARTVRSRLRKKTRQGIEDIALIIEKDKPYLPKSRYEDRHNIKHHHNSKGKYPQNILPYYGYNLILTKSIENMKWYEITKFIETIIKKRGGKVFDDFYMFFRNYWKMEYCPNCGKYIPDQDNKKLADID